MFDLTDHLCSVCRLSGLSNFYVRYSERELMYYRSRAITSLLFLKRNTFEHCLYQNDMLRAGMVLYEPYSSGRCFDMTLRTQAR